MIRGNQGGYTLIEMLVAISMSTVLVLAIGGFATNSVTSANQDYNKTLVLANAKEAVGIVARQVRLAQSVLDANSLADTHAPTGALYPYSWVSASGTGNPLVLAVPSRTLNGSVIYKDGNHSKMYTDNVIFYLDTSTKRLYKRTIADTTAPGTVGVTTCPPTSATPTCPADADVVDDVANLSTTYYSKEGVLNTGVPDSTDAVSFTVTETRTISGKAYSGTYTTIATLRNK